MMRVWIDPIGGRLWNNEACRLADEWAAQERAKECLTWGDDPTRNAILDEAVRRVADRRFTDRGWCLRLWEGRTDLLELAVGAIRQEFASMKRRHIAAGKLGVVDLNELMAAGPGDIVPIHPAPPATKASCRCGRIGAGWCERCEQTIDPHWPDARDAVAPVRAHDHPPPPA